MTPTRLLVISYGRRHAAPPAADLTIDLRRRLRDPAAAAWCLPLTGLDPRVRANVLATPGAAGLLTHLESAARVLLGLAAGRAVVVAVGCAGGRHRSVVVAEELAARVGRDWPVVVEHRHIDRPVLPAAAGNGQLLPETPARPV
jgi:UPF0042 nucleotide-binding protein